MKPQRCYARLDISHYILVAFLFFVPASASAQHITAQTCLPVLAKDYYAYAEQNNLREDFIKSIDSESWQEMRTNNNGNVSLFGGLFSLGDDYSSFDSKRTKYLESVHYNRTQQQARNILQIVTSPRAYDAYEACLRSVSSGVLVWASRQSLDEIALRVRYNNPAGVSSILLAGIVTGGSVKDAPSGHLWKGTKKWGVNQEFLFTINTQPGVSETSVTVTASDGSSPVSVSFRRADALLELSYSGTTDILTQKDFVGWGPWSPDNDHKGLLACKPNGFVGLHDGKWCTNRTPFSISTSTPYLFKNVRPACQGNGCPWASGGPIVVAPNGLSASSYIDNWGLPVSGGLVADLYKRLAAEQCSGDGPIPVIRNQAVLFAATKECLSIAALKWTLLPNHSQGTFRFGANASPDGQFVADSTLENPSVLLVGYKYVGTGVAPDHLFTAQ